jgi:hypothetical protein
MSAKITLESRLKGLPIGADKGILMPSFSWPTFFASGALPDVVSAKITNRVRAVARALDARMRDRALNSLEQFQSLLVRESATAVARFEDAREDADVQLALEEIAPMRLAAAKLNLTATDDLEYAALSDFLEVTGEGLEYDLQNAEDPAEVGDGLLRALDSLHHFLLAHDLVRAGYQTALEDRPIWTFRETRDRVDRPVQWQAHTSAPEMGPKHFRRAEPHAGSVCLA